MKRILQISVVFILASVIIVHGSYSEESQSSLENAQESSEDDWPRAQEENRIYTASINRARQTATHEIASSEGIYDEDITLPMSLEENEASHGDPLDGSEAETAQDLTQKKSSIDTISQQTVRSLLRPGNQNVDEGNQSVSAFVPEELRERVRLSQETLKNLRQEIFETLEKLESKRVHYKNYRQNFLSTEVEL